MDPFDTLPIKMPFKSRELYYYFHQSGTAFAVAPLDPNQDCMALATLDEHALRSTILIAGVHYSWNTGYLAAFESAFLFHKVESIGTINTWLKGSSLESFTVCVRQILTICLAEACLGNMDAAETHIRGSMALFDAYEQMNGIERSIQDPDVELAYRYLLLTSSFVFALKSRFEDFISLRKADGFQPDHEGSSEKVLQVMKLWHGREYGGLDTRLKAMRMFPHFFSPPPTNRQARLIDASPIVDCLRIITETVCQFRMNPTIDNLDRIWNDGGPTKLLLVLVTSHVSSFAKDEEETNPPDNKHSLRYALQSSWSGISATIELYMHSVLNITNRGDPIECQLLYRILMITKHDIDQTRNEVTSGQRSVRDSFWFWKVCTGALALAKSQYWHTGRNKKATRTMRCSCLADIDELSRWFSDCAQTWAAATGIQQWKNVEPVLTQIAWPCGTGESSDHIVSAWAEATFGQLRDNL